MPVTKQEGQTENTKVRLHIPYQKHEDVEEKEAVQQDTETWRRPCFEDRDGTGGFPSPSATGLVPEIWDESKTQEAACCDRVRQQDRPLLTQTLVTSCLYVLLRPPPVHMMSVVPSSGPEP